MKKRQEKNEMTKKSKKNGRKNERRKGLITLLDKHREENE